MAHKARELGLPVIIDFLGIGFRLLLCKCLGIMILVRPHQGMNRGKDPALGDEETNG